MDILDLMERAGALAHQRELDYFAAVHERTSRFVLWHTAGAGALLLAGYGQPFAALVAAQGWPAWTVMVPVVMAALWFAIAAAVMWAGMRVEVVYVGATPGAVDVTYQRGAEMLGYTAGYGFYTDPDSQANELRMLVQTRRGCLDGQQRDIERMQIVNGRRAEVMRWGYMASMSAPAVAMLLAWSWALLG